MRLTVITGLVCLAGLGTAQQVQYNYDRSANFSSYKTYEWVEQNPGRDSNQLLDQNIKRAVDHQLAGKGMQRVSGGADLQVTYQAAVDHEKQFDGWSSGPRWWGTARVRSSTIEIGKLVVAIYDPGRKQLIWRGAAEKTLDIKKDPDQNYRNLEKAMAKLFKNYPPEAGKN